MHLGIIKAVDNSSYSVDLLTWQLNAADNLVRSFSSDEYYYFGLLLSYSSSFFVNKVTKLGLLADERFCYLAAS